MTVVVTQPDGTTPEPPGPGWQASLAGPGRAALTIWTDHRANRCVLRLTGSLCADTVGVLDRHVDRLGCGWCDEVILDLGALDQVDQVGARLLVGLGHYVAARGGRFELRSAGVEATRRVRMAEVELAG